MEKTVNGLRIRCELTGNTEGNVVMLSHSLSSSMRMWDPQVEALSEQFRVLRYDVRGHGYSDTPPGPYTLDDLGLDAVGLMDALGIDKVHWVGLSMGGMIGQNVALNHPDRLLTLSLCDTTAVLPEDVQPVWEERIQRAREQGMEALAEETLGRWFTPAFLDQDPPVIGEVRRQVLRTPVEGYIGCSEAIRRLNYLERLGEIRLPTLIMVGADDPGTPVSAAEAMHRRITDSGMVVLPSAAHLSNIEQSEAFTSALLKFLNEQDA